MPFFNKIFPARFGFENKTAHWAGSDNYKNFRNYQPNPYDETSITYKYNSYGFRCDDFVESKTRLVFLGCSFVEGIGLPLEETFSHIIYREIKKRIGIEFPYWNLGLGGCGIDTLLRCYYSFHKELTPQVAIILFPTHRIEYFETYWRTVLINQDEEKIFRKNPHLLKQSVITYNIEKNLAMLDILLTQNKTLLVWDKIDYTNFRDIDVSVLDNFKNCTNIWYSLMKLPGNARDGLHPGKTCQQEYAKVVLDRYGDDICNRLINGAP